MKILKNYPSLQAYASYLGTYRSAFWSAVVVFAAANTLLAAIPWQVGQLTDQLSRHGDKIVFWTVALVISSIGHDILWRSAELIYLKKMSARNRRLDDIVFRTVLRHPYSFFVDKFTGKISSYANSLGREFRELVDETCYNYVNLIVTVPIITVTMFTVNRYTGILFAFSLVLMYIVGRKFAAKMFAAEKAEADLRSTVEGYAIDTIGNFVSVKAFASERREAKRLYQQRSALIDAGLYAYARALWFWGVMSLFVRWIIWGGSFAVNVWLYVHGAISLAQITTFLAAIVLFSSFIWEVIWYISQLNIRIARIEEAYRYLFNTRNIVTEPTTEKPQLPASAFKHRLELRDVSFAYPDEINKAVLHDVNLRVRHGEKIGIVGPSGGGKSTLLKLLLGYYPISHGQLLLDGQPVDNQTLADLTAYVPQDTAVFHRSISDNIAYAQPEATQAQIEAAAKHAQAHDFIRQLDKGYDTLVGERGVKLSGGQRQRVAIARAILMDAPLLLLDEATSALDSESEQLIQRALTDLLADRTALVIAHRLSTIQHLDRIVVFDNGTIVEEGSHADLLKRKGLYAKLWAHQSGGFIED